MTTQTQANEAKSSVRTMLAPLLSFVVGIGIRRGMGDNLEVSVLVKPGYVTKVEALLPDQVNGVSVRVSEREAARFY